MASFVNAVMLNFSKFCRVSVNFLMEITSKFNLRIIAGESLSCYSLH